MRIEVYFEQIQHVIAACPVVQLTDVTYASRSAYTGFVRGELRFVDGSVLHLREYVDAETTTDRLMYTYQYMSTTGELIFRYDNTGHHKKRKLTSYPHHKHDGAETHVIASTAPTLAGVLYEIEALVHLPE